MFNIFNKKKVILACTQEHFIHSWPPILSKDVPRPFLKKCNAEVKSYLNEIKANKCPFSKMRNTSKCNGILNMINSGYIIRLHRDIKITTYGDGEKFYWEKLTCDAESPVSPEIGWFPKEQYADHIAMPPNTLKAVLKIHTPWIIYSDEYLFIQTHPSFLGEHRFTVVEGILDPLKSREINIVLFWHVLEGTEILEAGTPIAQLIPIERKKMPELELTKDYKQMGKKINDYLIVKNSTFNKELPQNLFGI